MAARQLRTRRAPSSQKNDSDPPIFIPLNSSAKAEQQPSSSQQQRTPRSQEAPRKEGVAQLAQEDFPNQRREAHQGRRAERQPPSFQQQRTPRYRDAPGKERVAQLVQEDFPNQRREAHQGRRADQREALGLKVERERGASRPSRPRSGTQTRRGRVETGTESGRQPQPELKAPSNTDVRQRLRDTYNDVSREVTSAKILKQPDSSRSPEEQFSSSRSSMRQERSSQDHSPDTSTSSRTSSHNGFRGEKHGYQQPEYGRRNIDRSSRGARGAEETSGSSFQRRSEVAQSGAGIRNQWDDRRERNSRQEDTLQNRKPQVA